MLRGAVSDNKKISFEKWKLGFTKIVTELDREEGQTVNSENVEIVPFGIINQSHILSVDQWFVQATRNSRDESPAEVVAKTDTRSLRNIKRLAHQTSSRITHGYITKSFSFTK